MHGHTLPDVIRVALGLIAIGAIAVGIACTRPAEGQPSELSPLGIELVGPSEWLSGSTGSLRVVITDHAQAKPARGAIVEITLLTDAGQRLSRLLRGRTDAAGTIQAKFDIPDLEPGAYGLQVSARQRDLHDEVTQAITIKRSCQILLTTDKPIYQPSQVIHIRALALRRPALRAAGDEELTLEVSDAKGNKVFKQVAETNDFGVTSADFQLADEVNMGRYTVRAILGENEAEKTVTVQRYVLPKFKVAISTDRGYYLPSETVKGKVQADYFFGKPVSEGAVKLSVKTFDVEFTEIQKIEGRTDANGTFEFEATLPDHFVGQPLEQGKAFLQFEVELTDQAEHAEKAMHTSTVAASHLNINAVAESGNLVPGVENIIYVMLSKPTGEPAEGTLRVASISVGGSPVKLGQTDYRTDELGIAEIPIEMPTAQAEKPAAPMGRRMMGFGMGEPRGGQSSGASVEMVVAGRLRDGTMVEKTITIASEPGETDNLLLRVDRPLAKVGDAINATALCSSKGGSVFFDVIKDRQTMLTRAADIKDGKATTTIRVSPDITGTVYLSAYRIMPSGQIIRDTRPMFVQPASDLAIDVQADKDTYLPGGDAKLTFAVADQDGKPVAAALGINVVDESVFALQELQPGMEKIFFYLEQELMKPRYEIHGFELPTVIADVPVEATAAPTRAAKVVFASVDVPDMRAFQVNSYADRVKAAKAEWAKEMQPRVEAIQKAIAQYEQKNAEPPPAKNGVKALLDGKFLKATDLLDLWDREMRVEPAANWDPDHLQMAVVISAGPDGRFDTVDDVIMATSAPGDWFKDKNQAGQPQMMFEGAVMLRGMGMGGGGMKAGVPMDMAMPAAMPVPTAAAPGAANGGEKKEQVRVREFFPETLFFEPALITDETGTATLTIPMADSITTWRLAAMANSSVGQLGSTTKGIRCFQDFFVDIDLPVSLTQNDEVSIPIAVFNYLPTPQKVKLELTKGEWFELKGDLVQTLEIAANDVDVRYFTIKVIKIGDHPLTMHAYGSKMSDAIKRTIEVVPDGQKVETTAGGRLSGTVAETVSIPNSAIEDASNVFVKVYPGIFSQVVEGLDSILRMPFGCFEQTSSATWPNIMIVDYMKTTKQITPEIQMKAEGFINTGYQRMVSYEVPGGGFSWFGDAPANKLLTAYGLMEFFDMSAVHEVDPAVITRTQQWLLGQMQGDGSYESDKNYLHGETWGKMQVDKLLPTAYVLWGLTHSECKDARVSKSAQFVRDNWKKAEEPYSLAIAANALVGADMMLNDGDLSGATRDALNALVGMAKTEGEQMWWAAEITGVTNSSGKSADLEATGMAALALIRSGVHSGEVTKVLNYLIAAKDPNGTWYSTNATMLALRALVTAQKSASGRDTNGEVTVKVNGKQVTGFAITPENADVMRMIDCKKFVKPGDNKVEVKFAGTGSTLYQVVGRYYMPWEKIRDSQREPLSIALKYDKTRLAKDDTIRADVKVTNNTRGATSMIIVDLGVPPGFSVESGDFAELVGAKKISRFNMTGRQVIVYIEKMDPSQTIEFSYTLKAKFPLKAKTPKSTVYEYYNPENRADSKPVDMIVTEG